MGINVTCLNHTLKLVFKYALQHSITLNRIVSQVFKWQLILKDCFFIVDYPSLLDLNKVKIRKQRFRIVKRFSKTGNVIDNKFYIKDTL